MFRTSQVMVSAFAAAMLATTLAQAQVFTLSKEQLTELTAKNPFERFPDGRPKIPDAMLERARGVSAEEVFGVLGGGRGGFRNQYADGFHILHPGKKLVGRAFTVQFMPQRQDLEDVAQAHSQAAGYGRLSNQTAIDMLQAGDVLVVDLFGKSEDGTIVGDNLFYYIMTTTKTGGIVVDGSIRDLEGISEMDMPLYYRHSHPSYLTNVTLSGINIPIRIGNATVMPGDLVVGDPEGVYFIPPQMVQQVLDSADRIHIHDEWTRMKFAEGKYKSSDIYSSPKDPALQKEYDDYLKKKLDELNKKKQ
ncbi:MAG: dimethylmenaquinone methyltransferase [Bryobacteraceae bacterium]|jgi:regulator of RNase E activity RraA